MLTVVTESGSRYDFERSLESPPTHLFFGRFRKQGEEWAECTVFSYMEIGEHIFLGYDIDPKTGDGKSVTTSRVVKFEGDCQGYVDPDTGEWDHPYPMTTEQCPCGGVR